MEKWFQDSGKNVDFWRKSTILAEKKLLRTHFFVRVGKCKKKSLKGVNRIQEKTTYKHYLPLRVAVVAVNILVIEIKRKFLFIYIYINKLIFLCTSSEKQLQQLQQLQHNLWGFTNVFMFCYLSFTNVHIILILYVISKNYYIFSFLNFIILNLFRNFVVQNKRSKKQTLRTRKFAALRGNKISP